MSEFDEEQDYWEADWDDCEPPEMDEEELYFHVDCHLDRHGFCGKAGSEECDFECPFRHLLKG